MQAQKLWTVVDSKAVTEFSLDADSATEMIGDLAVNDDIFLVVTSFNLDSAQDIDVGGVSQSVGRPGFWHIGTRASVAAGATIDGGTLENAEQIEGFVLAVQEVTY